MFKLLNCLNMLKMQGLGGLGGLGGFQEKSKLSGKDDLNPSHDHAAGGW